MAPAQRMVYWQAGLVLATAVLIPGVVLLLGQSFGQSFGQTISDHGFTEWSLRFASMLIGGLSVVLPSWAYVALTNNEHRSEWLLLFAWVKIVGTIVLLAIGMILAPRPAWLLGGLVIAYLGHAVAAYRNR